MTLNRLPIFAIVGRPNVGKSTLFNLMTRSQHALVADLAGVTRDRQYGTLAFQGKEAVLIDTGGMAAQNDPLSQHVQRQVHAAMDESDAVLFMVDAQAGVTNTDKTILDTLRKKNKPLYLLVNKTDTVRLDDLAADCFAMGLGSPFYLAATQNRGVNALLTHLFGQFAYTCPTPDPSQRIQLAIIGRPNTGKSTLINQLLGQERMITSPHAGTTRDSIQVPFCYQNQPYCLVDTAGMRRRTKIDGLIEQDSVIQSIQAVKSSHVALLMLDAQDVIADQDIRLLKLIVTLGRGLVIAINKWDNLSCYQRDQIRRMMDQKLYFTDFADKHFISAKMGTGIKKLFQSVKTAYRSAYQPLSTPQLTQAIQQATRAHPLPVVQGRKIKLRYAHAGGKNPPLIVIHGKQAHLLPAHYQQYLKNTLRKTFKLQGTPIQIKLKGDA